MMYWMHVIVRSLTVTVVGLLLLLNFGRNHRSTTTETLKPQVVRSWEPKLWMLKTKLYQAHRLSRYAFERNAIREALFTLHSLRPAPIESDESKSSLYIGEQLSTETGGTSQYILLDRHVTILLYTASCAQADGLIRSIRALHPLIPIQVAVAHTSDESRRFCRAERNTVWLFDVQDTSTMWTTLAARATTKLVFVARDLMALSSESDLKKLFRVFQQIKVDVIGGAVRLEPEGKWYSACYKTALRNFTLRFHPGHDLSEPPCAYCDYIASPFIIERHLFLKAIANSSASGALSLVNMFLRLTHGHLLTDRTPRILSCVDVMFHVAGPRTATGGHGLSNNSDLDWLRLARKWTVNRIVLPGRIEYTWNCQQLEFDCFAFEKSGSTSLMPPCCLEERSQCVKSFLRLTRSLNISTGVFDLITVRTVLQQTGSSLPWASQYAIGWDASKTGLLFRHAKRLRAQSQCDIEPMRRDHASGHQCTSCVYHWLRSTSWRTELIGYRNYSRQFIPNLRSPTHVNVYGFWIETYANPGLLVWHQFAERALSTYKDGGKNNWQYQCPPNAVEHACLTKNVFPHGNIQFDAVFI